MPLLQPTLYKNVSIVGGPGPVRACIDELLPDILEGRIEPGRVFGRVVGLDGVPDGVRSWRGANGSCFREAQATTSDTSTPAAAAARRRRRRPGTPPACR